MIRLTNEKEFIFRVELGHHCLNVQGSDARGAVQQARRILCRDMPRMWDVIQEIGDHRFKVTQLEDI